MRTRTFTAVLAIAMLLPVPVAAAGHGAPQGSHEYQLNIIGTTDKSADMTGNNGHRIFVPLDGKTRIHLEEGEDFAVLDANGTDRGGATFQLPPPGLDAHEVGDPGTADVDSDYSVFIRPLGKPGGWATIRIRVPIFDDLVEGEYWEYDNHGLRLAQVRFYDCSTNVETGESTC